MKELLDRRKETKDSMIREKGQGKGEVEVFAYIREEEAKLVFLDILTS